jgi:hypothetical protein
MNESGLDSSGLGRKQVAGLREGGNGMLIPKNSAVNFCAVCETISLE